jgi:hypothetical protein
MPATASEVQRLQVILAGAVGKRRAVTIDTLAELSGLCRRDVEQALEVYLAEFPFPLVAGSPGYWQPSSADELNHYIASLTSRLRALTRRMDAVKAQAATAGWQQEGGRFVAAPRQYLLPI